MWQRSSTAYLAGLLLFAPAAPSFSDEPLELEEVFVTARKVREDLIRVPLSVQVVPGSTLERRNITSLYDLQHDVPGLVLNNRGMFGAGLALRGVTDEGGGGLSIAPHVNGVYLGRSNLALARMFDIERVEVVKGPQGTLYGRNATGGAINMITRGPGDQRGGGIEAAYGSFNTARIRAWLDMPSDRLSSRLAVIGSDGDGYIRNSIDDRRFAAEDYYGARASFRATPTDALTINVVLQHVEDDGASTELWSPRPESLPVPRDIRLTTVTQPNPFLTTRDQFASAEIAWQLGELTLTSTSGYARNVTRSLDDCAGQPLLTGCVRSVLPLRYAQWSEELRLAGKSGTTEWVVGAFAFDGDNFEAFRQLLPRVAARPLNDRTGTSEERAYALFGQGTRTIGTRWRATAGLRYSYEKRRVDGVGTGVQDRAVYSSAEDSWRNPSWRLGIERLQSDDTLWFASVATGFKSGGVSTDRLPDSSFDGYRAEQLTAWEVGVSTRSADRRRELRATAFVYDFDDMQVRSTRFIGSQLVTETDNAADVRIEGLDVSASAALANGLSLSSAIVWLPRREFVEYTDAVTGALLTGNDISRAPEWSATLALGYRKPIRQLGSLSADLSYAWRSSFFFTKENLSNQQQQSMGLLDVSLRFEAAGAPWYAFVTARNVLDEDYFNQIFLQSSPGKPAHYEIGFGWMF